MIQINQEPMKFFQVGDIFCFDACPSPSLKFKIRIVTSIDLLKNLVQYIYFDNCSVSTIKSELKRLNGNKREMDINTLISIECFKITFNDNN